MLKPRPTFGEVKAELIELGFEVRYTSKHVFFKHSSGTPFFALPRYEPDRRLSSIHALTIHTQLEHAGLIKEDLKGQGIRTATRQGFGDKAKKKSVTLPKASKKAAASKAPATSKAGKKAIAPAAKIKAQIKGKAHV